jgi:hypothetical protein
LPSNQEEEEEEEEEEETSSPYVTSCIQTPHKVKP